MAAPTDILLTYTLTGDNNLDEDNPVKHSRAIPARALIFDGFFCKKQHKRRCSCWRVWLTKQSALNAVHVSSFTT